MTTFADFASAGLPDSGVYLVEVNKATYESDTTQDGRDYNYVLVSCALTQTTGTEHNQPGPLKNPEFLYERFYTEGRGLARFVNFFQAVTGYIPTGPGDIDWPELCAELNGGKAWGVYKWDADLNDKGRRNGSLGWSYASVKDGPGKLKAPKPIAA